MLLTAQRRLVKDIRALDQSQSTEFQPVYKHTQEDILQPGEIVAVDIEILPSSTLFRAGEQLRLVISGKDIHNRMSSHLNTRNAGRPAVHTGQDRLSFLTIPVLPRTQSRMA